MTTTTDDKSIPSKLSSNSVSRKKQQLKLSMYVTYYLVHSERNATPAGAGHIYSPLVTSIPKARTKSFHSGSYFGILKFSFLITYNL